ncbi:MAG: dihydroorotate dehydrogenase electron transfer subunit [Lachnospiraceae bacterium]|nr:dihydroorotate dehydrogenase electron transfer subunit [Lachnospiraceae bacterium]
MKRKTVGKVLSQKCLAPGIYDLEIATCLASDAAAGQFVGVYTKDASALLPRPISICGVSDDRKSIRLVYRIAGKGTDEFSRLKEGDEVTLLGVLGNGYDLDKIKSLENNDTPVRALLLGGGIGVPPMLELSRELAAAGVKVISVMGYRNSDTFLLDEFKKYSDTYVASEDGSVGTKGNVLDAVRENTIEFDCICACGPLPMLRAIKEFAGGKPAFISLEERMACGVGACLGCVVKTRDIDHHSHVNNARICTDGPVFEASEVEI